MTKVKHLLFDCDGVLVDTEYVAAIKMTQALKDLGIDISVEYYLKELSGTTFSSIVRHYFNNLPDEEVIKIINKVEDQVAAEVKLISGVDKMLDNLHINKSVVSNSSVKTVKHALQVTGIAHHFSSKIYSSELVKQPKPAPDIYRLACESIGCDPSEILVIEDSISGTKAALAADFRVVGFVGASHILPGHAQKLLALGVENIASTTEELESILQSSLKV
jgi:HAD superfamily hydrolase (TIGR01509 family)